ALGHLVLPDPKAPRQCHRGLRTFIAATVLFVGRAAHRESIGWDEHHVRRRDLQQRAVELLRRGAGCRIGEVDAAKWNAHSAHNAPERKLRSAQDGVNSRWPDNPTLEWANTR